jgi:hypothetical protein
MKGASVADAARAWEFHEDWKLKLSVTRYELVEVKRGSIERAVIRMEVTRSGVISVQALYRLRSVQQRLPIVLPKDAAFDTDPLRINGRSVALESEEPTAGPGGGPAGAAAGDAPAPSDQAGAAAGASTGASAGPSAGGREYYIPLAGHKADESLLLELRYTMPGSYRRLDLPVFPSKPAVQKVYLCAYVPQEQKVLGSRGPWTDEMSWRWYETLSGLPQPIQRDDQLVAWVIEGLNVPNPFQDFATDGRLYTFSTLQPAEPPGGSLRLVAVHKYLLNGLVLVLVLVAGLLAIRRPLPQKFAIVVLLVMVLLAIGVFAPAFARQIMDGALLTAILIVAAAWLAWHVVRTWSVLAAAWAQRRAARAAAPPSPPATPPPAPAAASPFATQKGGPTDA